MTNDMMNLRSMMEKSADADLLRERSASAAVRMLRAQTRPFKPSAELVVKGDRLVGTFTS